MPTRQVAREVLPQARTLDSLVHAGSPDARVIFYMTWGHKNGNRFPIPEYRPSIATRPCRSADYELPRNGLRQRRVVRPCGHGVAPRAGRTSRLRALYAGLFPPRAAGSYLAANVIFTTIYGNPTRPTARWAFRRTGRISPAHSPANGPRKPDAAQSRITRRPDSTAEPGIRRNNGGVECSAVVVYKSSGLFRFGFPSFRAASVLLRFSVSLRSPLSRPRSVSRFSPVSVFRSSACPFFPLC